ncbi:hypothetical protein CICLE_v10029720mg [Citrus x clementina]|uniref:Uncharacterized protein n=1 Tax=Citrus clementina TaxID=85681 RepID=V4U945_CITCL|nr:hypothetical protein CICLE_v10029720mg [Citrus x clementina]
MNDIPYPISLAIALNNLTPQLRKQPILHRITSYAHNMVSSRTRDVNSVEVLDYLNTSHGSAAHIVHCIYILREQTKGQL